MVGILQELCILGVLNPYVQYAGEFQQTLRVLANYGHFDLIVHVVEELQLRDLQIPAAIAAVDNGRDVQPPAMSLWAWSPAMDIRACRYILPLVMPFDAIRSCTSCL